MPSGKNWLLYCRRIPPEAIPGPRTCERQRHPVRAARRGSLAYDAPRPAAVGHGVVVLPQVAGRDLGADRSSPAGAGSGSGGSGGHAQRGHHRQPVGEDHGKRGPRGYDAGKKVSGRKRHIVVDTMGLLLAVVVHAANIQDRGAKLVLVKVGPVSSVAADLGRCRLRGPIGGLGLGHRWLVAGGGAA